MDPEHDPIQKQLRRIRGWGTTEIKIRLLYWRLKILKQL